MIGEAFRSQTNGMTSVLSPYFSGGTKGGFFSETTNDE